MNADHEYQIGKDHTVCQDYAVSGVIPTDDEDENFAYAIVCDGCSASPDVDCGARLLALSAREFMCSILSTNLEAEMFGKHCIRLAALSANRFAMLHPQAFDATLLIAIVKDRKLTAFLFGDGVFIHRSKMADKSDLVRAIHIKLTVPVPDTDIIASPPDYLAYELDQERKVRYLAKNVNKTVEDYIFHKDGLDSHTEKTLPPFAPVIIRNDVDPGDVIAVCSDGIGSFRQPNNDSISWRDLIDDYTGFKTTTGVFVHRHISAFKRKCQKKLITHSDDISIAAIVV